MLRWKRLQVDLGSTCFDGARQGLASRHLYGCDKDPGEIDAIHPKKLRAYFESLSIGLIMARGLDRVSR
jgi:hypothetical protein